jgi:hypothetical protein
VVARHTRSLATWPWTEPAALKQAEMETNKVVLSYKLVNISPITRIYVDISI